MKHARCCTFGLLAVVFCVLVAPALTAAEDGDARQLVQKTLEALPRVSFVAEMTMTGDLRGERQLVVKHKVVDDARSTYLEVVAPDFLVGMRFLFEERVGLAPVQHMRYIATRLPVLIADDTRAQPFLGSTFSLVDVAEPELNGFTYEFVGQETIGGRPCKLVESTPKEPDKQVYGKIVQAIDPKDLVVMRRKFFDHEGKPLKEWTATKVEKIGGYWTIRNQRMRNLQRDVESRIEINKIEYGADIPDSVFTKDYLIR